MRFNFEGPSEVIAESNTPIDFLLSPPPQVYNTVNGVNLNIKTHNIFVYTNIVKEILVGNSYLPLIRTVATREENRGGYVSENFIAPYYLPLSSNYIKHIMMELRDDQGENIKFRGGKVTVMLHFRMVN